MVLGLSGVNAQQNGPSATRSFSLATAPAGGQLVVTVAASNYGAAGFVEERLPAGFSYVSSTHPDGDVKVVDDRTIRFRLFTNNTFTYTVTVPDMGGSFDFDGFLRDDFLVDHTVGGDKTVTVEATEAPGMSPEAPGVSPEPPALEASAIRSFGAATVPAGGQLMVTITASNYGRIGSVEERLPAGFSYVSSTHPDAGVTFAGQAVRFALAQGDNSLTYTVTVPDMGGSYDFDGSLQDFDRGVHLVSGATRVTVEAAEPPEVSPEPPALEASATRSFGAATVPAGGQLMVTITASNYGRIGSVEERLPAGFSYVSSTHPDAGVTFAGQAVRFALAQGDNSLTYTVTAPDMGGSYDFDGSLQDFDRGMHLVGGATRVTVEAAEPPEVSPEPPALEASATRSFGAATVPAGGQLMVTITASNYGRIGSVEERLPAGFSYVSSTHPDAGVTFAGQAVRFALAQGDNSLTYTVTAPDMGGSYDFDGSLQDFDRGVHLVGGATRVTVMAAVTPEPTRRRRPSTGGGVGVVAAPTVAAPTPAPTVEPVVEPTMEPATPEPTVDMMMMMGPEGEQGAQGEQGEQGAQGDPGPRGETGARGPDGPQGAAGSDGSAGAMGAAGDLGPDGAGGQDGARGPTGQSGAAGQTGAAGDAGATGASGGVSVLHIIALIIAVVALVGAGGAYLARRS